MTRLPNADTAAKRTLPTSVGKHNGRKVMKSRYKWGMTLVAGFAFGTFANLALHAQGTKPPKVWIISEIEPVPGEAMSAATIKEIRDEITKAHGTPLRTLRGLVVHLDGGDPPKAVAMNQFDSLDDAVTFNNSDAWKKSADERA